MTIVLSILAAIVVLLTIASAYGRGYRAGLSELRDQELIQLLEFTDWIQSYVSADGTDPDLDGPEAPTPASPQTRRGFGVSARTRRPGGPA